MGMKCDDAFCSMSRRSFAKMAAMFGTVVLVAPGAAIKPFEAFASNAGCVKDFQFSIISDIHLWPVEMQGLRGDEYLKIANGDFRLIGENDALTDALVDQIISDAGSGKPLPSFLIVSGDMVDHGEKAGHRLFVDYMKRLMDRGCSVLVTPGNHDLLLFGESGAKTFEHGILEYDKDYNNMTIGSKEEDFREIYANMGYDAEATINASGGKITSIEYFKPVDSGKAANVQGGLSYIAKTAFGVAFFMLDVAMYSNGWNGSSTPRMVGSGMMTVELMNWIKSKSEEVRSEGLLPIAAMHYPFLSHVNTQQARDLMESGAHVKFESGGKCVADTSNTIATLFADAGIPYVFTGHMHENDVSKYTSSQGNVVYDLETGALCAYPAGYRRATLNVSAEGDATLAISCESVRQAAMGKHLDKIGGSVVETQQVDAVDFLINSVYGDPTSWAPYKVDVSYVTRIVMKQFGDSYLPKVRNLKEFLSGTLNIDVDTTVKNAIKSSLAQKLHILDDPLGDAWAEYREGQYDDGSTFAIHVTRTSLGVVIAELMITEKSIQAVVNDTIMQIQTNYLNTDVLDYTWVPKIIEKFADADVADVNASFTSNICGIRTLVREMFIRHNGGFDGDAMPSGMQKALDNLKSTDVLMNTAHAVVNSTVTDFINEIGDNTTVSLDTLMSGNESSSGFFWKLVFEIVFGSMNPTLNKVASVVGLQLTGSDGIITKAIFSIFNQTQCREWSTLVYNLVLGLSTDGDALDDRANGSISRLGAATMLADLGTDSGSTPDSGQENPDDPAPDDPDPAPDDPDPAPDGDSETPEQGDDPNAEPGDSDSDTDSESHEGESEGSGGSGSVSGGSTSGGGSTSVKPKPDSEGSSQSGSTVSYIGKSGVKIERSVLQ